MRGRMTFPSGFRKCINLENFTYFLEEWVRYVAEVARLGSIQAAARELSISQSSILAAIDLAEADIGARMFMRRPSQGM
eukprot:gene7982-10167_t